MIDSGILAGHRWKRSCEGLRESGNVVESRDSDNGPEKWGACMRRVSCQDKSGDE